MNNLISELKRRNVFRVAAAYMVISWLFVQILDLAASSFEAPAWVMKMIIFTLLIGFIPTLLFSWVYELTPDGLKRETEVDSSESISSHTSNKLNVITLIAVFGILGLFIYQQINPAVNDARTKVTHENQVQLSNDIYSDSAYNVAVNEAVNNKSVAVLPFTNMANDPKNEPFTLGLHDDLLTHLSKISALKVISRTSVMEYKETTKNIKLIADELGVANILEGGVQRAGNKIRLNVQLIDAATDEHIWAEIYDSELTTDNIFEIQTEISQKIATALKAQLTDVESQTLALKPTSNLDAYDAYLAARQLVEKRTGIALEQAKGLYQKAIELDPNYVLAYAGLAITYRLLNEYTDLSVEESIELSEPILAKALMLAPTSAEANLAKAALLDEKRQYAEAEKAYKYVLNINPNNADALHMYGHMLRQDLGRFDEALKIHQRAAELDPLSRIILTNVGWALLASNRLTEAFAQFEKVNQLDSDFPGALSGMAWVNDVLGNSAKAAFYQERAVRLDNKSMMSRNWLFNHFLNMNDATAARAELEKSKAIASDNFRVFNQEIKINAFSGNYAESLTKLIEAVKQNENNPFIKKHLARHYMLNKNCQSSIAIWREIAPDKFESAYVVSPQSINDDIEIVWCLFNIGEQQKGQALLEILSKYKNIYPINNRFTDVRLKAVQGHPEEAARLYAEQVALKLTRDWFRIDHQPYLDEVRQQPAYIQAREKLMIELAKQRELYKQYQSKVMVH